MSIMIIDEYEVVSKFVPSINISSTPQQFAGAFAECFKTNVDIFYKHGLDSFLTERSKGDKETFYIHTISHYVYDIIKDTYRSHRLGPGVWSMEGFESKNAQSKRAVCIHSNRKGNLPAQSIAQMYLQFVGGKHDVEAELKKMRS